MRRVADCIRANLTLRVFLPLLALALVLTWWGLFWSTRHFASLSGGLRFVDMQPWLTAESLFAQIRTYTPETIEFYLWWSALDYPWPFVSFTAMLFISAWLFGFLPDRHWRWFPPLVAIAYTTVLMDFGENIGFALLVTGLPDEPMWLARVTLLLHAAKLLFNMVFNVGFWVLLGAVTVHGLRRKLGRVPDQPASGRD